MHQHLGHRDGGQGVHDHGPLLPPSEHLDQIGLPESKVEQEKASEGEHEEGEGALDVIRVGGEEEELFSKPGPAGKGFRVKKGPGWNRVERQKREDERFKKSNSLITPLFQQM